MKWGLWSTTAGSNSATPPDGWPEGMAPSTVNDAAREMMAQIRVGLNDLQFIDQGFTPTRTGANTFTVTGNQMAYFEYGRRVKASDGGTKYGTVISSSFTTNTGVMLRFDGTDTAFATSLTAVASSIISNQNYGLPEGAFNDEHFNLNGDFDIWQRGFQFGLSAGSTKIVADRFRMGLSASASVINVSRSTDVPSVQSAGVLLTSSLCISVSTACTTVPTTGFCVLDTFIEGYDFRQFAQLPFTVSFWAKSTQSGIYALAFSNAPFDQSLVQNFTLSSTAWTHITIAGLPTPSSGTWDYSNGVGLRIRFALASGSSFQSAAGVWGSAAFATSSQVNFLSTAGNTFKLTGLRVHKGMGEFPLKSRPFQQELERCRRYTQVFDKPVIVEGFAYQSNAGVYVLPLAPAMRVTPTVAGPNVAAYTITNGAGAQQSLSAINAAGGTNPLSVQFNLACVGSPLTAGQGSQLQISLTAAVAGTEATTLFVIDAEQS